MTTFLVYAHAHGGWTFAVVFLGIIILLVFVGWLAFVVVPDETREFAARKSEQDARIICPHCQRRGDVRTESVTMKKGIDGGKATAALLTGGATMLATGLSRKENLTKATCRNCGSSWTF